MGPPPGASSTEAPPPRLLQFAPRSSTSANATATATDVCAVVALTRQARPSPSLAFVQGNAALVGVGFFIIAAGTALFYAYRDRPQIKARLVPLPLTVAFSVGAALAFVGGPLRYALNGTMPCVITPIAYLSCLFLVIHFFVLRAYVALQRSRRAKLAAGIQTGVDDAPSSHEGASHAGSAAEHDKHPRLDFRFVVRAALMLSNDDDDDDSANATGAAKDANALARRRLYATNGLLKGRTILAMLGLYAVPFAVILIILLLVVEPYRANCSDCEVFAELLIANTVIAGIYTLTGARAAYLLSQHDDGFGVNRELVVIYVLAVLSYLSTWVLYAVDPNQTNWSFVFDFEIFSSVGVLLGWFVSVGMPVVAVVRNDIHALVRVQADTATSDRQLWDQRAQIQLMREAQNDPEWLAFAQSQLVTDAVRFLQDCSTFESYFFDKSPSWRVSKARIIADTYIREGAVLQINVSWKIREGVVAAVTKAVATNEIAVDVFAPAAEDVAMYMVNGPWQAFTTRRRRAKQVTAFTATA